MNKKKQKEPNIMKKTVRRELKKKRKIQQETRNKVAFFVFEMTHTHMLILEIGIIRLHKY